MTPIEWQNENDRLVALIRALEADIANPVSLQERIQRDEAQIEHLKVRIAQAKERQAHLPVILDSTRERLREHRTKKPSSNAKVARLLKLKEMMNELLSELGEVNSDS
jgi:hypothetical protein